MIKLTSNSIKCNCAYCYQIPLEFKQGTMDTKSFQTEMEKLIQREELIKLFNPYDYLELHCKKLKQQYREFLKQPSSQRNKIPLMLEKLPSMDFLEIAFLDKTLAKDSTPLPMIEKQDNHNQANKKHYEKNRNQISAQKSKKYIETLNSKKAFHHELVLFLDKHLVNSLSKTNTRIIKTKRFNFKYSITINK